MSRRIPEATLAHYQRIVFALTETIRLTPENDFVIETRGGWPGAFQGSET